MLARILGVNPLKQDQRSERAPIEGTPPPDPNVRPSAARWPRLTRETSILLAILAVTSLVYLRCLANGFVLDDGAMIVNNPDLGNWSFLWKAFTREEFWYSDAAFLPHYRNYRPLLLVNYWIHYHLFGLNPAPWHASIVAVHLLATWLVFKIARRLTGESTPALLAASLFALTPIHAAAVVWMAASGMVLSTTLILAAFYLIMQRAKGSVRNWAAAIACYAGALLCHESAIAFPALVACYAFLFAESDAGETVSMRVAFSAQLFDPGTADRMRERLLVVLEWIAADRASPVDAIELIAPPAVRPRRLQIRLNAD